jgi:predicted transcriptional regulator
MKVEEICSVLNGKLVCGNERVKREVTHAFASDLMSDVLTVNCNNLLLITGLANLQAIRTAEMSDIECILFVRNKSVTDEMKNLAEELGITLITCPLTMFRASGELYRAGMKPLF